MRLLLDLDNTLVDRDGAFGGWAEEFAASVGGNRDDVSWLLEQDAHGYRPRADLAEAIGVRFGDTRPIEVLVHEMREGVATRVRCFDGVIPELERLKEAGASLLIVTNGAFEQQKRKIETSGLAPLIEATIVSDAVRAKKPDRRIFQEAMRGYRGAEKPWMVGDHPTGDMAGARAVGLSTAWVSHSTPWTQDWTPDIVEATTAAALRAVRHVGMSTFGDR